VFYNLLLILAPACPAFTGLPFVCSQGFVRVHMGAEVIKVVKRLRD